MMRSHVLGRAFLACWCGIAAYCLLSVIAGPAGVVAYRGLETRVSDMKENLGRLAATNESLSANLESLRSDPGRAAAEARALGYIGEGERALVLAGAGFPAAEAAKGRSGTAAPGGDSTIVRFEDRSPLSDLAIKEISAALALLALGFGLARDFRLRPVPGNARSRAFQH